MSVSLIWKHFMLPSNTTGNFRAVCKYCGAGISCSKKTSSNLHKHLKRRHPTLYTQWNPRIRTRRVIGPVQMGTSHDSTDMPVTFHRRRLTETKYLTPLENAIMDFLCDHLLPLSTVESESFRALMNIHDPRFHLPSRERLLGFILPTKLETYRHRIQSGLRVAMVGSVCVDTWTSKHMESYLGITVHYINNWCFKRAMLRFCQVNACHCTRHTADRIHQLYEGAIEEFGMTGKVGYVIAATAKNTKPFHLPGFVQRKSRSDCDSESNSDESESDEWSDSDELSDSDGEGCSEGEYDFGKTVMDLGPKHHPYFNHNIHLVVRDGLRDTGDLSKPISKVSAIIDEANRATKLPELLVENHPRKPGDMPWSSELKCIRAFLKCTQRDLSQLKSAAVTDSERSTLQDLLGVMGPFEEAIDLMQEDKAGTASFIIPCIMGMEASLTSYKKCNTRLADSLLASLKQRLSWYKERQEYQLATALDPRFRLAWATAAERASISSTLIAKASRSHTIQSDMEVNQSNQIFIPTDNTPDTATTSVPHQEVGRYLQEPNLELWQDAHSYWKRSALIYPCLATVAECYLSIPSSSPPVERLLPTVGEMLQANCSSGFEDKNLENMIFCKVNKHV